MASHHIARELTALGHEVKQVPPSNRVEAFGLFGFSSTAIAVTPGTSSRSSSSRFATNSAEQRCQLPFQNLDARKKVPTSIREGGITKKRLWYHDTVRAGGLAAFSEEKRTGSTYRQRL